MSPKEIAPPSEQPCITCQSCLHFRQHYILFDANWYSPAGCGHCVYPRLKHRPPQHPACVHFSPRPSET